MSQQIVPPTKILVAEDDSNLRLVIQTELQRSGHDVRVVPDGEAALRLLEEDAVDVLLCDVSMPRVDGIELLRRVRQRPNPPEVVILVGGDSVETAIEAVKLGAYYYLAQPYRMTELDALVGRAAEKRRLRVDNRRLRAQLARRSETPEIVYASESMREVMRLVERVAPSDASVLIAGESGTGKLLVARAIHRWSSRAEGSFVDLNCATVPEELLESELFGHEAGALPARRARRLGVFELADRGTLFLDEVTTLPAHLQSKLLRAVETRSFYRVGAVRKVTVDVRLVVATDRDMHTVLSDGTFRSDLLYRINGFQISLPALRERPEDIEPLSRHLLGQLSGAHPPELAPETLSALRAYAWPGNVRQLRNCLERAALLAKNGCITTVELPPEIVQLTPNPMPAAVSLGSDAAFAFPEAETPTFPTSLHEIERRHILSVLKQMDGDQGKTAEILGISSSTLYRRLRDYKLIRRP